MSDALEKSAEDLLTVIFLVHSHFLLCFELKIIRDNLDVQIRIDSRYFDIDVIFLLEFIDILVYILLIVERVVGIIVDL